MRVYLIRYKRATRTNWYVLFFLSFLARCYVLVFVLVFIFFGSNVVSVAITGFIIFLSFVVCMFYFYFTLSLLFFILDIQQQK